MSSLSLWPDGDPLPGQLPPDLRDACRHSVRLAQRAENLDAMLRLGAPRYAGQLTTIAGRLRADYCRTCDLVQPLLVRLVGSRRGEPISYLGTSYTTAHEAALALAASVTDAIPKAARPPREDGMPIIVSDVRPEGNHQTDPVCWQRYYHRVLARERVLVPHGAVTVVGPRWADFCRDYAAAAPPFDSSPLVAALRQEAALATLPRDSSSAIHSSTTSPAPSDEAMATAHQSGPRPRRTERDGIICDSCIWLKGKPYQLTPGLRTLLSYLLMHDGAQESAVMRNCGYSSSSHLHKRLADLRRALVKELKQSGWRLQIKTEKTCIYCRWDEVK